MCACTWLTAASILKAIIASCSCHFTAVAAAESIIAASGSPVHGRRVMTADGSCDGRKLEADRKGADECVHFVKTLQKFRLILCSAKKNKYILGFNFSTLTFFSQFQFQTKVSKHRGGVCFSTTLHLAASQDVEIRERKKREEPSFRELQRELQDLLADTL